MEEKKRKLVVENKAENSAPNSSSNLTEKIKLLQKHQALQAEIERHKPQITEVGLLWFLMMPFLIFPFLHSDFDILIPGMHKRKPTGYQEP